MSLQMVYKDQILFYAKLFYKFFDVIVKVVNINYICINV